MSQTSHLQGVRLLFSIDLSGSTEFKSQAQRRASLLNETDTGWPNTFGRFHSEVSTAFIQKASELGEKHNVPCKVSLWKAIGDEVTFYSSPLPNESHVAIMCHAFARVIDTFDRRYYKEHKLGAKGTVWSAGFPFRNKLIRFDPKSSPYFKIFDLNEEDFDENLVLVSSMFTVDFLGPDIDLGFRLASHAVPRRPGVSLDVAVLLARASHSLDYRVRMFHVGWARLKGIHGDMPYPIIWIDTLKEGLKPEPRTSYEEAENPFSNKYLSLSGHLSKEEMLELNVRHFQDTKEYRLERPYLDPSIDPMPAADVRKWKSLEPTVLKGDDE